MNIISKSMCTHWPINLRNASFLAQKSFYWTVVVYTQFKLGAFFNWQFLDTILRSTKMERRAHNVVIFYIYNILARVSVFLNLFFT